MKELKQDGKSYFIEEALGAGKIKRGISKDDLIKILIDKGIISEEDLKNIK